MEDLNRAAWMRGLDALVRRIRLMGDYIGQGNAYSPPGFLVDAAVPRRVGWVKGAVGIAERRRSRP